MRRWLAHGAMWVLVCLALEIGLRAADGLPLLPDRNLIAHRADLLTVHQMNDYDPALGWRLRSGVASNPGNPAASFTTCEHGIRSNVAGACAPIPSGAILAVGDSFTAGSEVGDAQSWPAALERVLGRPVVNAAAGAWGSDQIVLRARQLAPVLAPSAVIVSFLDQDILRAAFKLYGGGAKPWFTVEPQRLAPGEETASPQFRVLVPHDIPVPQHSARGRGLGWLRGAGGYSHVLDAVMMRTAPAWWLLKPADYVAVDNDPVEVSCLLLRQLRPALFVLQWGGDQGRAPARPEHARRILECTAQARIPTLDLWDALHAAPDLRALYVMQPDDGFGHMSAVGNELVAHLIAEALRVQ